MPVGKNCAKMDFLKMETSTSTMIGHVGAQKPSENVLLENENIDINEDGACV